MSGKKDQSLTFARLDSAVGLDRLPEDADGEYSLPAWYRSVWHTPLNELTLHDICRACAQNIHAEHIVPIAVEILQSDPLAGDMYEGHLLSSLIRIPQTFWLAHPDERNAVLEICKGLLKRGDLSDDVRRYIKSIARNLAWDWGPRSL